MIISFVEYPFDRIHQHSRGEYTMSGTGAAPMGRNEENLRVRDPQNQTGKVGQSADEEADDFLISPHSNNNGEPIAWGYGAV